MTYGKLENGYIQFAPKKLIIGDSAVYNPTNEQYTADGWKPCEFSDMPVAEIGYHVEESWADNGEALVQSWEIVQNPPGAQIPEDEAFRYLFGGERE